MHRIPRARQSRSRRAVLFSTASPQQPQEERTKHGEACHRDWRSLALQTFALTLCPLYFPHSRLVLLHGRCCCCGRCCYGCGYGRARCCCFCFFFRLSCFHWRYCCCTCRGHVRRSTSVGAPKQCDLVNSLLLNALLLGARSPTSLTSYTRGISERSMICRRSRYTRNFVF